jgi:hypothetical protein
MSSLEIRLAAMPDDSAASLREFVRANVKPGATLLAQSYLDVAGYDHASYRTEEVPRLAVTFDLLRRYRRRGESVEKYLYKFVTHHNNLHREVSFDTVLKVASRNASAIYRYLIGDDKSCQDIL